jgi:hypothetical protein
LTDFVDQSLVGFVIKITKSFIFRRFFIKLVGF